MNKENNNCSKNYPEPDYQDYYDVLIDDVLTAEDRKKLAKNRKSYVAIPEEKYETIAELKEQLFITEQDIHNCKQENAEFIKRLREYKLVVGGKVEFIDGSVHLGEDNEWEWSVKLSTLLDDKYRGKNIEIYIREE